MTQEAASQPALRNCSREVGGGQDIRHFGEGVRAITHTSLEKGPASHAEELAQRFVWVLF